MSSRWLLILLFISPPPQKKKKVYLMHALFFSLKNIIHEDNKLYLVFEFLDQDLKRYLFHLVFFISV